MNPEYLVQIFIVAVIVFGYGTGVSWMQERFGKFQDASPRMKQLINSLLTFVLPLGVELVTPYWRPEFGDAGEVLTSLVYLCVPVFIWLWSQVAHQFDPARKSKK